MQHSAVPVPINQRYTSVYATPDGETHLRTVDVRLEPSDFAPPAEPLLLGDAQAASSCFFLAAPGDWGQSDLAKELRHPTPRRQFCTVLRGEAVVYASDGTFVRLGPGETVLLEDVPPTKGHNAVNTSTEEPCLMLMVQLVG
jgi:uncharacterized cupin superfamily protein